MFALEMGYGLLVLADKKKAVIFLIELPGRTNFAKEMGMLSLLCSWTSIELEPNGIDFCLRRR